jgi:hypothetical protein
MILLLLLPATILLSLGTINHQSVDASGSGYQASSSEPKNCSINLDFITEYPPYFQLYITSITDENNNLFHDNELIAIKADKGSLAGGQSVDGWNVYSTTGACITGNIKYIPPTCEISKDDILSFATVYKTEDGSLDIGSANFTKKITNPICLDAGSISGPEKPEEPEEPEEPEDKPGNSTWTGSIHLDIRRIFTCDVEYLTDDEASNNKVFADDERRTTADIMIELTDFDLTMQGNNAGAKLQDISGMVTVVMQENHSTESTQVKTRCYNQETGSLEWLSPGNWDYEHETMAGQATLNIKDGGLTLLIAKEMLSDKDAVQDMQQKISEIQKKMMEAGKMNDLKDADKIKEMYSTGQMNVDKEALENLKGEMRNTLQGDQGSSSIPIKVSLTILTPANRNYPVATTNERKALNVCAFHDIINESRSDIIQMPLMLPVSAEMKGTYTRGKNGNDRIYASVDDVQPFHAPFKSDICPEETVIIKGNITLERKN